MKFRLLLTILALGFCFGAFAESSVEYPRISFVGPGGGKGEVDRSKFIILVVEGPFLSYDKAPIEDAGTVEYVNSLLKARDVSYIAVYPREGVKYGDVVRAVDALRKTNAKNIGVSLSVLPAGREP